MDEDVLTVKKSFLKKLVSLLRAAVDKAPRVESCTQILHYALKSNVECVVDWLLESGVDVNMDNDKGRSALYYAVKSNSVELVEKTISKGANVNKPQCFNIHTRSKDHTTALHLAVQLGHDGIVHTLLDNSADVNCTDSFGRTPLHCSVYGEHDIGWKENISSTLLSHGANVNTRDNDGNTPLLLCLSDRSRPNRIELLELLLRQGADVNITSSFYSNSPLMIASNKGCALSVKTLLEHGANINHKNRYGETALHDCSSGEIVDILVEGGAYVNARDVHCFAPLLSASSRDCFSAVNQLIQHGANVNHKTTFGETAMHYCSSGEVVDILVDGGADVNAENAYYCTPLIRASSRDCFSAVKQLIQHGANVNYKDEDGRTALHYCLSGDVVDILLERGADVNAEDDKCCTPLLSASSRGCFSAVKQLIQRGANVNHRNMYNETALHDCSSGEVVDILVERGADINAEDAKCCTPLLSASSRDCFSAVKQLIQHGANVNHKDEYGQTALHDCSSGEVVDILVEGGADVNAEDNFCYTPLLMASSRYCFSAVKKLVQYGANVNHRNIFGTTSLHDCSSGEVVDILVDRGADVNAEDNFCYTPLLMASSKDCFSAVEQLIQHGANVNHKNRHDVTALHYCSSGEVVDILVERGADVNAEDDNCCTPLLSASSRDCFSAVKQLIEHGANVNHKIEDGQTALHNCSSGEVVDILVDRGADVNAEDYNCFTPLLRASGRDCFSAVKQLIQHGANVNHKNEDGRTALHYCLSGEVVDILVERGADVNAEDANCCTPLLSASCGDCFSAVKQLIQHGANVNHKNEDGRRALHYCLNGDVGDILVKGGADVNAEDDQGRQPLIQIVSQSDCAPLVKLLLEHGADSNHKDTSGKTALHVCLSGMVVDILVEGGADVNVQDNKGSTSIHETMYKLFSKKYCYYDDDDEIYDDDDDYDYDGYDNDLGKFEALLLAGAELDLENFLGQTCISLYRDYGGRVKRGDPCIILTEYFVKCKSAGLKKHIINTSFKPSEIYISKDLEDNCLSEIKKLSETKYTQQDSDIAQKWGTKSVTLHDILTKESQDNFWFVSIKELKNTIESDAFIEEFPIYFKLIRRIFKRAEKLALQKTVQDKVASSLGKGNNAVVLTKGEARLLLMK